MPDARDFSMTISAIDISQSGAFTKWVQMISCYNDELDKIFPLNITLNGQDFHLSSYEMMMTFSRALTLGFNVARV